MREDLRVIPKPLIAIGFIVIVFVAILNYNYTTKAVNNCISEGQSIEVCERLY